MTSEEREIKVLDHGHVRYVDHMGSDERVVESARVSYKSPSKGPEDDQRLINYLWRNRHTSPFEMVKVTFNIKLPIFVMRQFVRHRMQNLNEVSARYTQLPSEFYIPVGWRRQDTKNKQSSTDEGDWNPVVPGYFMAQPHTNTASQELVHHCIKSYKLYERMLEQGIAREMARMVLPINIYTEIYTCWDLRNLMHFFTLRDDGHAQFEIQEYARAMKRIARVLFPKVMMAYDKYKWNVSEG